jgi:cellulose synthase/poly-beta-1,6-N-acetylglucosamine synthase-like glycosyltransferase
MSILVQTIFWLALLALFYIHVGYAVLIGILARNFQKPVHRIAIFPTVSIIIAVRDGAGMIEKKIVNCLGQNYPDEKLDIIVVSDGSTDGTAELVQRSIEAHSGRLCLVELPEPRGKAHALNAGVLAANGEILVFTDVRQRLDVKAIRTIVENFADPAIGGVGGNLILDRDDQNGFGQGIDLYWRYEKWLRLNEGRFNSSVGVSGAFYALRRSYFQPIPANTLLDDVYVPMTVVEHGGRVVQDSCAIAYDVPSNSRSRERQRKIRTIAGNYQLLQLKPSLLRPLQNPIWWQFISHKVLRLMVPIFLFAAWVTNLFLLGESFIYVVTFICQLSLYLMAIIGIAIPARQTHRLIRISSTFVSLNWFNVLGLLQFVRKSKAGLQW